MGCGCGLIGSLVICPGSQDPVYSKPFARGGPSALFSFEVLLADSSVDLVAKLQHKNRSDTTWADLANFASGINSAGVYTKDASGIKQQLRWMFHFDTSPTSGDLFKIDAMNAAWRSV